MGVANNACRQCYHNGQCDCDNNGRQRLQRNNARNHHNIALSQRIWRFVLHLSYHAKPVELLSSVRLHCVKHVLSSSQTATTTFALQYFAQATDVSSSFSGQKWFATVLFRTPDNTTGTGDVLTGVTLNTTNAINVTTSSINYGTITANSDTGSTNQSTTVANVGNSSTSLQINALSTLVSSSSFAIATSSQGYYTAPFTYRELRRRSRALRRRLLLSRSPRRHRRPVLQEHLLGSRRSKCHTKRNV